MESAVLESRWDETFDFWGFWEMCERKIKEMWWKSTRKWEKTKKHKSSKKKLGFVIRQFLSMRLRDEENTPWSRETKSRSLDWERRRDHELKLECHVISSMIAELRFVFRENEIVTDLRERACDIWERVFFGGKRLMACLEVKKRRGSRVEGGKVI